MRMVTILFLSSLILFSCSQNKTENINQKANSINTETDKQLAKNTAEKIVETFAKELKSQLLTAMKDGGASNAVKVCSQAAPVITREFSSEYWQIKRVSDKWRRASNQADEREMEVLNIFKDSSRSSIKYYDEWVDTDSSQTYYYYKPIRIGKFCLNCHGLKDDISPKVIEVIKDRYPDDMATGYTVGDLRGMFIVKASWPQGLEEAKKILNDSL